MGDLAAELQQTKYLTLKRAEYHFVELAGRARIAFQAALKSAHDPRAAKQDMEEYARKASIVGEYARLQLTTGTLGVPIERAHLNSSRRAYLEEQLRDFEVLMPQDGLAFFREASLAMPAFAPEEVLPDVEKTLSDQAYLAWTTAARYAAADAELTEPWVLLAEYTVDLHDSYTSARLDEEVAVRLAAEAGSEHDKEERIAGARAAVREKWADARGELVAEFADSVKDMAVTFPAPGDGKEARPAPSIERWFHTAGSHVDHAVEAVNLRTATQLQNAKSTQTALDDPAGHALGERWDTGIRNREGSLLLERFLDNVGAADHYRARAHEAMAKVHAARAAGEDVSEYEAALQDNLQKFARVSAYARHDYHEQALDFEIRLSAPDGGRRSNLMRTRAELTSQVADAVREGKELAAQAPRYEGRRTVAPQVVRHHEQFLLTVVTAARFGPGPNRARYVEPWVEMSKKTLTLMNREAARDIMVGRSGPLRPTADVIEGETVKVDEMRGLVERQMAAVTSRSPLVVPLGRPEQANANVHKLPMDAVHRVLAASGAPNARTLGEVLSASYADVPGAGASGVSDPYASQVRGKGPASRRGEAARRAPGPHPLDRRERLERRTDRMLGRLRQELGIPVR